MQLHIALLDKFTFELPVMTVFDNLDRPNLGGRSFICGLTDGYQSSSTDFLVRPTDACS